MMRRSSARSSWVAIAAELASAAGGSARTTRRLPVGRPARRSRTRWRSLRSTRLRVTAGPTARDTTKPARAGPGSPLEFRWTTRIGEPARLPDRTVSANSSRRRRRAWAGSTGGAGQADRRLRPLARRAERIARPARVRIRRRKPWVLARRRLFGWKVRLLTEELQTRGPRTRPCRADRRRRAA